MTWRPVFFAFFVGALQIYFSDHILFKGQVVKQFTAHSIARSLKENNFQPLKTSLPCPDPGGVSVAQPWAEEPPIFHAISGVFMSLGLENPALPSIVLSLLLGLVLFFLARLWDQPSSIGLWALVGTSPVFMRYFSQHMPDLCAVLFLVVGVWARVRKKNAWAFCFFVLACTTKLLVVFPVAMILLEGALDERGRPKSLKAIVVALLQVVFAAVPFLLWIKGLHFYGILNPFGFKSLVANRHSGGWSLLWTPAYWSHFATWVGSKGVGWPLLIFALVSMVRRYRDVGVFGPSSFDRLLFFWSLGLVPYWILVRAGNFTHDYYFLPFFVPIAFLGARQLLEFRPCWARWIFVFLSLGVGLAQPWRLSKDLDVSSLAAAPSFCGMETGKYREAP